MQVVHDMTNSQTLLDVSKALAAQLWNALKDDPQTNTAVTSQDQIMFSSPKTASAAKKKVAICLHSITPDQSNKNVPSATGEGEGKIMQAPFTARYLIIPCTGNPENDLLLLGKTLQTLSDTPVIALNSTENGSNTLTVTLDSLSLSDLCKLWMALGEPLKPSLSVTVTFGLAASTQKITPAQTPASPQVVELYGTVFETFEQQINDWKSRNLFQKQYVQSDFAKNIGMTVDAMRAELRDLGEKLQTNRPTEPYMEALKRLQEFYEHQLGMLKGFEKVQKKRQEGIDLVAKWKNDVSALIEALNALQH